MNDDRKGLLRGLKFALLIEMVVAAFVLIALGLSGVL